MLIAAALLLAAPAPAADRPMLDTFRTACDRVEDLAAMNAAASADGWQEMPESADPRVEKLIRTGRDAVGEEGEVTGATFRRALGGRTLYLINSRFVDKSGFWGNGCRLYHFEADAAVDPRMLQAWMGRAPSGSQDLGPGIGHKLLWEPGWRDGVTVEINHVRQGTQLAQSLGLSGNVLVAQATGGF